MLYNIRKYHTENSIKPQLTGFWSGALVFTNIDFLLIWHFLGSFIKILLITLCTGAKIQRLKEAILKNTNQKFVE